MTAIAQKLDQKLESWDTLKAAQVEQLISEIIDAADADSLDLIASRLVTQEVLDLIDESQARRGVAGRPGTSRENPAYFDRFPR